MYGAIFRVSSKLRRCCIHAFARHDVLPLPESKSCGETGNLMLRVVSVCVLLSIVQSAAPARPIQDSASEIRALLTAYEKRDVALPPDPESLGKIARMVMAKTARSQGFPVWSEECASRFVTDKAACDAKLQRVLDDKTKPI